jgi:hypothetical protein
MASLRRILSVGCGSASAAPIRTVKDPSQALLLLDVHIGATKIEPCLGHGSNALDHLTGGAESIALIHKTNLALVGSSRQRDQR